MLWWASVVKIELPRATINNFEHASMEKHTYHVSNIKSRTQSSPEVAISNLINSFWNARIRLGLFRFNCLNSASTFPRAGCQLCDNNFIFRSHFPFSADVSLPPSHHQLFGVRFSASKIRCKDSFNRETRTRDLCRWLRESAEDFWFGPSELHGNARAISWRRITTLTSSRGDSASLAINFEFPTLRLTTLGLVSPSTGSLSATFRIHHT